MHRSLLILLLAAMPLTLFAAQAQDDTADTAAGEPADAAADPAGSDEATATDEAATDGEDTSGEDAAPDDADLDEQVYEEDDDDFIPSEEIPADQAIPFPTNI